MFKQLDMFDAEEQAIINRSAENENLKSFSRAMMMQKIDFAIAILMDTDIIGLYEGLKVKVSNITDSEWSEICSLLPYDLPYSDEDVYVDEDALS